MDNSPTPKRQLSLFDSTCIIVGIMVGAAIYKSSPTIASSVGSPLELMGVWLLGGVLSLVGALCYAELTNAYPKSGGDYVYLTRAYGPRAGFLFAWSELWVVRPGSIGSIAFVFAHYANELYPLGGGESLWLAHLEYAIAAVGVLTVINILGVREGKWTQNLLTTVKIGGLALVVVAAFWFGSSETRLAASAKPSEFQLPYSLAMILVLYTYGGWNEMAYVAAEVRDPGRNILRALLLGTLAVILCYVGITAAFLYALGFDGTRTAQAVAADVVRLGLGNRGQQLISLLICISTLGSINGQIFTGARIYYAMGLDHRLYAPLGRWHPRLGTPISSLVVQAIITLGLMIGFGRTAQGFEQMALFTTPAFWFFFLLVGTSVIVLRYRDRQLERPFRVPCYPLMPLVFCSSCLFMLYSSIAYAWSQRSSEVAWAIGLLAVGVAMSLVNRSAQTGSQASIDVR